MRTRYVKVAKLTPIQNKSGATSMIDIEGGKVQPKLSQKTSRQIPKSADLLEIIEETIRKELKINKNRVQLQARDCFIEMEMPECDYEDILDDETLRQWVTDVCNNVFSAAFNFLSKDMMNLDHIKVYCSECILRNIYRLTQKFDLTTNQMKIINQHIEKGIVPYMQRKYPLTESSDVNKAIDQCVRPIDNRQSLENDLLRKMDFVFTWRKNGDYSDLIMKFLNWLMTSVDHEQQQGEDTPYEDFYNTMSDLFENVYDQGWMKNRTLEEYMSMSRFQKQEVKLRKIESLSPEVKINQDKYSNRVKQYTSYAIGRKISKNTPVFTDDEIQSGHLNIKNSAILRILTKWCEELWGKFTKKNYFLDREENIQVQQVGGNVNTMFMWMKMPLNDLMEQQKRNIQEFMKDVTNHNFDQQSLLLIKELEKDGFTHVKKMERACGKYASRIVNNLHCYIVLYLNRVIHGLLSVSKTLYDSKLSTKNRWTSPPNLLSFKIGDIMRCKCSSKEREVLKIFKELERISQKEPNLLKIIRIKNRLKAGTNDILINIMFQNKFLCQIQLAVKSASSKFIQCSNMFSHYIYELGRTLFGPITELCSVWMSHDSRGVQYSQIVDKQKRVHKHSVMGCQVLGKQHDYDILRRPFICSDCHKAYSSTNYIWGHDKCKNCSHMLCSICQLQNEDDKKLKDQILEGEDEEIINACTTIVNRRSVKTLPTYGLSIKIKSKRIIVNKFKKIEINNILSLYGFYKDKNGHQSIYLIQELVKPQAEQNFLKNNLVFQIPQSKGDWLIPINIERAKKDYLIPQKVKDIYKKEKEIMSLIQENMNDQDILITNKDPRNMEKIKNMELADNKLTKIDFITAHFVNLTRLQLSRNQVSNIETISKLQRMKKLNLRDNKLTKLPDQLCQLTLLQGLNIRNNQLTQLPADFGKLIKLNKLEADNNKISTLPCGFENLIKMNFMNLSKNKLTTFPIEVRQFKDITTFKVGSNKIHNIPDWIEELTKLQMFDVKKINADNLPSGIFTLKNLTTLKFTTSYDKLDQDIRELKDLQQLSLQMPNLKILPKNMQNLFKLNLLELEECQIGELPDFLSEMKGLVNFSLINNNISQLSREVCEMKKLRYLKIENQNITSLPDEMKDLTELKVLSLSKNKFRKIPEVIRNYTKLYHFTIDNNEIEQIPDDFFDTLQDLQVVYLNNNKLKQLPFSLSTLKKIKTLLYDENVDLMVPQWIEVVKETIRNMLDTNFLTIKMQDSLLQLF